jgi:hypothetical protein
VFIFARGGTYASPNSSLALTLIRPGWDAPHRHAWLRPGNSFVYAYVADPAQIKKKEILIVSGDFRIEKDQTCITIQGNSCPSPVMAADKDGLFVDDNSLGIAVSLNAHLVPAGIEAEVLHSLAHNNKAPEDLCAGRWWDSSAYPIRACKGLSKMSSFRRIVAFCK